MEELAEKRVKCVSVFCSVLIITVSFLPIIRVSGEGRHLADLVLLWNDKSSPAAMKVLIVCMGLIPVMYFVYLTLVVMGKSTFHYLGIITYIGARLIIVLFGLAFYISFKGKSDKMPVTVLLFVLLVLIGAEYVNRTSGADFFGTLESMREEKWKM